MAAWREVKITTYSTTASFSKNMNRLLFSLRVLEDHNSTFPNNNNNDYIEVLEDSMNISVYKFVKGGRDQKVYETFLFITCVVWNNDTLLKKYKITSQRKTLVVLFKKDVKWNRYYARLAHRKNVIHYIIKVLQWSTWNVKIINVKNNSINR